MYARAGGQNNRGFEGGQNPLHKRFPKFGFQKARFNNSKTLTQLNLGQLTYAIEKGRLDTSQTITMKHLLDNGVVSKINDGVKLLGKGTEQFKSLGVKFDIEVADASKPAIDAIK